MRRRPLTPEVKSEAPEGEHGVDREHSGEGRGGPTVALFQGRLRRGKERGDSTERRLVQRPKESGGENSSCGRRWAGSKRCRLSCRHPRCTRWTSQVARPARPRRARQTRRPSAGTRPCRAVGWRRTEATAKTTPPSAPRHEHVLARWSTPSASVWPGSALSTGPRPTQGPPPWTSAQPQVASTLSPHALPTACSCLFAWCDWARVPEEKRGGSSYPFFSTRESPRKVGGERGGEAAIGWFGSRECRRWGPPSVTLSMRGCSKLAASPTALALPASILRRTPAIHLLGRLGRQQSARPSCPTTVHRLRPTPSARG